MTTLPDYHSVETLPGLWRLDPQRSSVEFRVEYAWGLGTAKGHFERYEGRLDLSTDPAIELMIDAASVQTGNRRRDKHLRSATFFDAENHPSVRFVSDSVVLEGDTLEVRGRLSARDQSIPLELEAHLRGVDGELEIKAAPRAQHRDLGMTWSPLGIISPHSELLVTGYLIPTTD
ncbi:MAG: YceI family protein [Solirubrobacterales bacterium]|nr:YceI family protein [Solirubrobacterales bacterium]